MKSSLTFGVTQLLVGRGRMPITLVIILIIGNMGHIS